MRNTPASYRYFLELLAAAFLVFGMSFAAALAAKGGKKDDTAALQSVLDSGNSVVLVPGKTYRITRSLEIRTPHTGIIGDGTAAIVMGAETGEFDNASPLASDRYGANAVGIAANGIDNPILRGVRITYEKHVDDRYVKAVAFRRCSNIVIAGNEAWNFSKSLGIIYVGGSTGGRVSANHIHDSSTNSATTGQITGIEFDNDDLPSSGITIARNNIHGLTVGPDFRRAFGYQTDGINTVRPLTSGLHITGNVIADVGEAIDHFGRDSVISGNTLRDCYNFCIKLIHGASRNRVENNNIERAGLGGIVLAGTRSDTASTSGNTILRNDIKDVDSRGDWTANESFGIGFSTAPGTSNLPSNNVIAENTIDLGRTGKIGILAPPGSGSANQLRANLILNPKKAYYLIDFNVVSINNFDTESRQRLPPKP